MKEEDLREIAGGLGYELLGVKRFKGHDRLRFRTPEGNTLTLNLTDHIENIDQHLIYEWLGFGSI